MTLTIFEHLVVGPLGCNCYVVGDAASKRAIVIDPGGDIEALTSSLQRNEVTVTGIVATHAHFDHLIAAESLRELTGAPFYMHASDRPLLDWYQESGRMFLGIELPPPPAIDTEAGEGDLLVAGAVSLEVVHTPGHSPGSISLVADEAIFSGDTLFAGSVGRSDLPGGNGRLLVGTIRDKLFEFDDPMLVYPGHGPATTIGEERRTNPFVGDRTR